MMELPLQLSGTISTEEGISQAMLCMDIDRPDEAMLHWWNEITNHGAILVKVLRKSDGSIKLEPKNVYHVNSSGGLFMPRLSAEQFEYALGFRGHLQEVNESLEGAWTHTSGKNGRLIFPLSKTSADIVPEVCASWNEFKEWTTCARDEKGAAIFRGHGSNSFRLRTTLHRAGMHRLERYCAESLVQFRGHAEAVLGVRFNLSDADDYSTLLGLTQHHGLPTPMLDWTSSPYIAAFFAFSDAVESLESRPNDTHVRIYGLAQDFVNRWSPPVVTLPYISPYVSSLAISPINNSRLYAQQGKFLVTNIADLEYWLCSIDQPNGQKMLIAADVPITCAYEALKDLQFMGLTAATMFPGLDGVCRMLKHEMSFNRQSLQNN